MQTISITTAALGVSILAICAIYYRHKERAGAELTEFARWITSALATIAAVLFGLGTFAVQTAWSDDQMRTRLERLVRAEIAEFKEPGRRYYEFNYEWTQGEGAGAGSFLVPRFLAPVALPQAISSGLFCAEQEGAMLRLQIEWNSLAAIASTFRDDMIRERLTTGEGDQRLHSLIGFLKASEGQVEQRATELLSALSIAACK